MNDGVSNNKVYVVGHKNPDTDSICSAIAYANLKSKVTGEDYSPRRAGQLNEETQYVLEHFQVEPPKLLSDLRVQVKMWSCAVSKGSKPAFPLRQPGSI